jgi:predicted MFS family arabinose efflux permease
VVFNVARFIGPIFAGLAIVWSGVAAAFLVNALSYVAFLVALARLRVGSTVVERAERPSLTADLVEGIRYTATHPGIAALLVLLIAVGIGGRPMNELLPGFADEVYKAGAGGLSILASAIGGGAILGGLWLGQRGGRTGLTVIVLVTAVIGSLATIVAIATDRLWVAVPAVTVFGFCMAASGIAVQTLIQLGTDRAMRGRVLGLYGLIFRGAPAVGALIAGVASAQFGLRWPVFLGALLVIGFASWTFLARKRIAAALEQQDPSGGP